MLAIAATNGTVAGTRSYGPWGRVMGTSGRSTVLGLQGDWSEPATGVVDMGARDYLPMLGRFTTPDPLRGDVSEPVTLNRYLYAAASPLSFVDPLGLCAQPGLCPPPSGSSRAEARNWNRQGRGYNENQANFHSGLKSQGYPEYKPQPVPPRPARRRTHQRLMEAADVVMDLHQFGGDFVGVMAGRDPASWDDNRFITWSGWDELQFGIEIGANALGAGLCAAGPGVCAVSTSTLLIGDTIQNRVETARYDWGRFSTKAFQGYVLTAVGSASGLGAGAIRSKGGKLVFNSGMTLPGLLCTYMCEPK